ncbi:hybrid sensor histidine kinase/response regulator [Endozoicomonas sp. OPT23]|uniref:ATP-binding response regulator n=1 Tax=Endozoicomonas sp. OPT23 TaxID=2072845 RepID=UPI00129B69E5|nr:response regulator [Endozoicomonas sp. OPT23]MRI33585.1 hybrid sensor histidine kinase/response regulator [Endozoicomonas sp. OPT23]
MYVAENTVESSEDVERILLVDDNPTNLQVLLQTLSGRGYKLLIAKNGESALRIAHKAKPALVLLDIMMPGMDGYEVCRQLKEDPQSSNITVIFLSALDDTKDKVRGLETGAVDFISKPFQSEEVIARVETQLKIHRLEQALSARNRQLEADKARILESMNEGIFGLDSRGHITFANAAASQMTGWTLDHLTNRGLISLMLGEAGDEARSQHLAPIQDTLNQGVSKSVSDALFWTKDGTSFPVSYSCTPIMEDENPNGAVVVFTDITSKRRGQAALKKALDELDTQKEKLTHVSRLSTMGEMAAGFAHEVNQPLTAISNYAQVAKRMIGRVEDKENDVYESLYEAMDKINTQARRAGDIIARIRSFVKKPDHVLGRVDPVKLLNDTVKLAEVDARNNSMEIHMELAPELPEVKVDPVQIQQVALNLIRNGMEAMRDQETRNIGVWVKAEVFEDRFVKVSVIDRGYGLAEDAEEKLFTPFYTTKSDGMGIGLTVCHSIIQSHGGRMSFQRHSEGGTVFEFTMPIAV